MVEVRQTQAYAEWFSSLEDRQARARIDIRIRRLSMGNPGDVKPVGEGISELRFDFGPGYRVYCVRQAPAVIVLLLGGEKKTQQHDIGKAKQLAQRLKE